MLTNPEIHLFWGMFTVFGVCMIGAYVYLTHKQMLIMRSRMNYLCPSWEGRLGNLMFQYASLYGIAQMKNKTFVIGEDDEIGEIFPWLFATRLEDMTVCDEAKVWQEQEPCLYDEHAVNVPPDINIRHLSYLQSWKYFTDYEFDIRQQFFFDEDIEFECQSLVDKAVVNWTRNKTGVSNVTIVGVHIRREDLLREGKIKYGYQTATPEFINKSMQFFRNNFSNVVFLVFTAPTPEDLQWRQDHVTGSDVILMDLSTPAVDLCSLSKCNHTIMTVGSFGWWGSWLANGTTVYFKDAARNGSELRGDFSEDMTDYYYPGWIGM